MKKIASSEVKEDAAASEEDFYDFGNEEDDGMEDEEKESTDIEALKNAENRGPKRKNTEELENIRKSAKTEERRFEVPSLDELKTLRETQMLYHSNIFRLAMEELLREVSMKSKTHQRIEKWMIQFSKFVKSLPSSEIYPLDTTDWMKERDISNPMPDSIPKVEGKFIFIPPTSVEFVGSFSIGTTTSQNRVVDVMLILPEDIVHKSDHQNGSWLVKRSRYLAWLASELRKESGLVSEINWTTHQGCPSRPLLQVTPAEGFGKKWKINLFPVPSENFKLMKFTPSKSNISPKFYMEGKVKKDKEAAATPFYNWTCSIDIIMERHAKELQASISENPNLVQGIMLIKVWLAQRNLDKIIGGISGHLVSMLVLHLLRNRKLNTQMSPYQVFRHVVLALCNTDWTAKGLSMCSSPLEDGPSLESFHSLYEVVFVDSTGLFNLAAGMSATQYLRLKHEAELAMNILDSSTTESFDSLFIQKVEAMQMCDQLVSVKLEDADVKRLSDKLATESNICKLDRMGDLCSTIWSAICKSLREGLADRVTLLVQIPKVQNSWPLNAPCPDPDFTLVLGVILDPFTGNALLTKGPSADSPDVKKFRSFWGEKSSLRRFQDGSFHEAVLWGNVKDPIALRRQIPITIMHYILSYHYGIEKKTLKCFGTEIESLLRQPVKDKGKRYGTGEEEVMVAIQSFDSFSRKLRSLQLPLNIASIYSTSEVNRHTSVFPPQQGMSNIPSNERVVVSGDHMEITEGEGKCPTFISAMNILIFLEISKNWPRDRVAMKAIKVEFYNKIKNVLEKDHIPAIVFPDYLQVLWDGYVYRLKICHRQELSLLRSLEDAEVNPTNGSYPSLLKEMIMLPKITSSLASIQAKYPGFSSGARLAKRWVASQMLLPHLPSLAVELLVAYLFLKPGPYLEPHSPQVTLYRFLKLLVETDWKKTPFLINLSEAFTVEDESEINNIFANQRETLPSMFIATPHDLVLQDYLQDERYKFLSVWTKENPSIPVIYRLKQLAEGALSFLEKNMFGGDVDFKTLFRPSLEIFDVIIRLNPEELSRREEAIDWRRNTKTTRQSNDEPDLLQNVIMPVVMYDAAALYMDELRRHYGHLALFFHDEHGGAVIGVVWRPEARNPQPFKVGTVMGHKFVGTEEIQQVANIEAIIEDFSIMGTDLIKSITVNNQ